MIGQFVNSTTGFASGVGGAFLASADGGSTWALKHAAPTSGAIYGVSFLSATTGFAAGDVLALSETTNGGASWQAINTSNISSTDRIRALYFTDQNTGFIGTANADGSSNAGSICQSTDGGQTWNPIIATSNGIYNINFIPGTNGQNGVALGRSGVAYWTADGGMTWTAGTSDQPNAIISRSTFLSAALGYAVALDNSDTVNGYVLRTIDGGQTWTTVYSCSPALDGIDNDGNETITAAGYGGVIVESTDAGGTWNHSNAGSSRWVDVRYASQHRVVLFGANGDIDTRDK